ncbi:MAG: hypothetical protein HGA65_21095 [Oscillochloris sp.]|nr:hypothetical protein [Oscillochloris sp.]
MLRFFTSSFAALLRALRCSFAFHPAILSFSPPDDHPPYSADPQALPSYW